MHTFSVLENQNLSNYHVKKDCSMSEKILFCSTKLNNHRAQFRFQFIWTAPNLYYILIFKMVHASSGISARGIVRWTGFSSIFTPGNANSNSVKFNSIKLLLSVMHVSHFNIICHDTRTGTQTASGRSWFDVLRGREQQRNVNLRWSVAISIYA